MAYLNKYRLTHDWSWVQDRFKVTLVVALALHSLVILGIGFKGFDKADVSSSPVMAVTLTQYQAKTKPEQADFIGQANQEGGGTSEEIAKPATTQAAEDLTFDNAVEELPELEQQSESLEHVALYALSSDRAITQQDVEEFVRRTNEVNASQQVNVEKEAVDDAKKNKKRTISASVHEQFDALYLYNWRKQIERIGNQNYPEEARARDLYGDLLMGVSIYPDGKIDNVRIIKSSGHAILDEAAIRIVRLSAPFPPFTPQMREHTDVLEIVRLWQFQPGSDLTTR